MTENENTPRLTNGPLLPLLHISTWLRRACACLACRRYKGAKTFRVILFDEIESNPRLKALFLDQRKTRWERKVRPAPSDPPGPAERRELEIWRPDLAVFPELMEATVMEGTVNAGDWIFLPGGALHAVSNEGNTWGVSINALMPPALETFADVCAKARFQWQCGGIAELLSPACQGLEERNATAADIAGCLRRGEAVQRASDLFASGPQRDLFLPEVFGFASFAEWCAATCESARDDERRFLEEVRSKGFNSTEAYYRETEATADLETHLPASQVNYICAQCQASPASDLESILYSLAAG